MRKVQFVTGEYYHRSAITKIYFRATSIGNIKTPDFQEFYFCI